jgi:hypothetical protein
MIERPKIASNDNLVRKFKLFYELFAFSSNYPGVKRHNLYRLFELFKEILNG